MKKLFNRKFYSYKKYKLLKSKYSKKINSNKFKNHSVFHLLHKNKNPCSHNNFLLTNFLTKTKFSHNTILFENLDKKEAKLNNYKKKVKEKEKRVNWTRSIHKNRKLRIRNLIRWFSFFSSLMIIKEKKKLRRNWRVKNWLRKMLK